MKYVDEFRDGALARGIAASIARQLRPGREYRLMEFCGGHTHAISRYGIADLLPPQLHLIHGPGCPVCVLPVGRIDQAIRLALEHEVILCSYGDALRVPASDGMSLLRARGRGAELRMVYSPLDALQLARARPGREVVFLALGFETTTPPTAVALRQARAEGIANFSVLCNHVLTPPAMRAILEAPGGVALDGFIGPAHVSTVIGSAPYVPFAREFGKPVVIAGFEPLDVLRAIQMLVAQIDAGRAEVENEFTRAVGLEGNRKAQALVAEVFALREAFEWRGLGTLLHSALRLRPEFAAFDAERRFAVPYRGVPDHKACECAAVLRGDRRPQDCRIFGTACTPDHPVGACMVSSEGACAAHYSYGRFRAPSRSSA
ncbi:MAG: hydrogenase formation protein HypD [Thauera phenolivorans]|uniref:Hydrogenase maturation factor n=1 Tax=Thauera phenolivorans TaxID=1792543 RepID=A0A7X7R7P5_9RHOO|nr:hydrogenase formation protein HypD [Thauera phenolivorans]NLF54355.1 hydrogenase formation protein HypD [Thauera phenolivorans]